MREKIKQRLGMLGQVGVWTVVIGVALNIALEILPYTGYHINQRTARGLFWTSVAVLLLGIVFILIALIKYRQKVSQEKPLEQGEQTKENYQFIKSIPSLITDIDKQRAELIQAELDKKMNSGDTQFVFNMLNDTWRILLGTEPPTLPTKAGNEDIGTIIDILLKYVMDTKKGAEKIQERTKELGELETGLLTARVVNKYLGIDDELAKDPINEKLKLARELLPSRVAVETTKAIDSYLNYSRAYRATDAITIPLVKIIGGDDFLESIPIMKKVIDMFQRYKEIYLEQMNINQAKVNEALKLL